ncbi:hypothetical protein DL762_007432 [Monosporascus cannonballus]|uniref:JmjC domain-containing protein n=1 Tax=Monosporascus cannonballus TaxID=155416 RepID=A0ABY0H2T5_9PEZI|nr:hypothetical protein DL762_007432 [Monosporascus cannonballus]
MRAAIKPVGAASGIQAFALMGREAMIRNSGTLAIRFAGSSICKSAARVFRSHSTQAAAAGAAPSGRDESAEGQALPEVRTADGPVNLFVFRLETFDPELPLVMRNSHQLPATTKWFRRHDTGHYTFTPHLTKHSQTIFPYELTDPEPRPGATGGQSPSTSAPPSHSPYRFPSPSPLRDTLTEFRSWLVSHSNERYLPLMALIAALTEPTAEPEEFQQFYAPLGLLARACEFNHRNAVLSMKTTRTADMPPLPPTLFLQRLYIAQSRLDSLPAPLGEDLPTPGLVRNAGRGDIYDSSVWLGLEPTYTPLHRDPNPNLFCQMVGAKQVRLLPPARGEELYAGVRRRLGEHGASSRFRGAEMMGGAERTALDAAVWGEDGDRHPDMRQAVLRPGDSMFIPKGWWHSIRSTGTGVLNASVNWWFR